MYIVDGICYAGNDAKEIRVKDALPLNGGMILVTFDTGEKRLFDTTLLNGSAFEPLRDQEVFKKIDIFHGVMTWNNGDIDIAPETVYEQSYPYNEITVGWFGFGSGHEKSSKSLIEDLELFYLFSLISKI